MHPIFAQALAPFAPPPLVHSFNDDDWYEYNAETLEYINHYSGKTWRDAPKVADGHKVVKGIRAKYLNIWRKS